MTNPLCEGKVSKCDVCFDPCCSFCCKGDGPSPFFLTYTLLLKFIPGALSIGVGISNISRPCSKPVDAYLLTSAVLNLFIVALAGYLHYVFGKPYGRDDSPMARAGKTFCCEPFVCVCFGALLFEIVWSFFGFSWAESCDASDAKQGMAYAAAVSVWVYLFGGLSMVGLSFCMDFRRSDKWKTDHQTDALNMAQPPDQLDASFTCKTIADFATAGIGRVCVRLYYPQHCFDPNAQDESVPRVLRPQERVDDRSGTAPNELAGPVEDHPLPEIKLLPIGDTYALAAIRGRRGTEESLTQLPSTPVLTSSSLIARSPEITPQKRSPGGSSSKDEWMAQNAVRPPPLGPINYGLAAINGRRAQVPPMYVQAPPPVYTEAPTTTNVQGISKEMPGLPATRARMAVLAALQPAESVDNDAATKFAPSQAREQE